MKLSKIRTELLAEHTLLRGRIDEVRKAMGYVHGSESMRAQLRALMGQLAHDLREHNRHEEELLHGVLLRADAWGPVREEAMNARHLAEHREISEAFVDARAVSDVAIDRGMLSEVLDRMLAHMANEEIVMLGEDVLRDDATVSDQFTG